METWKHITENYEISSLGRIRSSRKSKILKTWISSEERESIKLNLGDGKKNHSVHRLVALTFLPLEEGKHYVNHKDGNSLNNCVDNLEWCTQKENIHHSKNITKNGAVVSVQKIQKLYKDNTELSLEQFINLLIENSN